MNVFASSCIDGSSYRDLEDFHQYIVKVGSYDGTAPRQLQEQFAENHGLDVDALKAKVSATGTITCGGYFGAANLTLSNSVLSTAHHIMCEAGVPVRDCKFEYTYNDVKRVIPVDSMTASGGDCSTIHSAKDWAVLKLAYPALGPKPYKITKNNSDLAGSPLHILAVNGNSLDFCLKNTTGACTRDPKTHRYVLPKTIQECDVRATATSDGTNNGTPLQHASDCAASQGASGSAMIKSDLSEPILLGVLVSTEESKSELAKERKTGTPVSHPFSTDQASRWYTIDLPVAGEFAAALEQAATSTVRTADESL